MKTLTPKEKKAIEGIKQGKTKRQAINEAYNCKNLKVADVIGQKVFKKEKVIQELELLRERERRELLPKAMDKINEILSSVPEKSPSWDVINKASQKVLDRAFTDKSTKEDEIKKFSNQFIKIDKFNYNKVLKSEPTGEQQGDSN
jgi:hypothetical protein